MSSPPPPKRPPMFLVLGIILAIVGMIVMLKSADNLAGVVGILFTIFGVIINLLQLYIPMPLFLFDCVATRCGNAVIAKTRRA